MPELPSGRIVAISRNVVLPPGRVHGPCPEGHFWYHRPDPADSDPATRSPWVTFSHAPVPANRHEAARYVQVLFYADEGQSYWAGDWLASYERPDTWDDADWHAWQEWLASPRVTTYLDGLIDICRAQAEANPAAGEGEPKTAPPAPEQLQLEERVRRRTTALQRVLLDLLPFVRGAREAFDEEAVEEFEGELRRLAAELDDLLDECDGRNPMTWYVRGLAHRLQQQWPEAERCYVQSAHLAPQSVAPWAELCVVRGMQDRYVEAEDAARRAMQASNHQDPKTYRLLAMALEGQGLEEQAGDVIRKAEELEGVECDERGDAEAGERARVH